MRHSFSLNCIGIPALSLLCLAVPLHAQSASPQAAQTAPAAADSADLKALANSIRELQSQVQSLTTQIGELRTDEQRANAETRELRKELELARSQPMQTAAAPRTSVDPYAITGTTANAMAAAEPNATTTASSTQQPSTGQTLEQRVSNLEESQQLTDAKLNDQYQTKVESSSKYRVRLSGMVLLNLFENRGNVDNLDFPEFASARQPIPTAGAFGGTVRQSEIGLEVFGPDIAGAHTRADVKMDFGGGFPPTAYGFSTGVMRLRTGTLHFDWENTSVIAGQDYLFFSPLDPTSLASLAVPAFSYAGNLWAWTPQVRVEHRFHATETSNFTVSAGILDSVTGEAAVNGDRTAVAGERSGQPAFAARAAWTHKAFGRDMTIGFGGYSARQNWGFGRHVDGWAGTTDVTLPLGKHFDFSGEFYRGRSVGGIGGGIGESVLLRGSGMLTDPTAPIRPLDSMGGWAQLKYTPVQKLQFNAAFGQDNPFSHEFRGSSWNQNFTYELLKKNVSWMGNFIYQPRSDVLFSLEYRRLRTLDAFTGLNFANQVSMSAGYIF
ncbi:MAG TPA: hypothetical protein VFO34_10355 [Candidatus Acidoferrales bacterium]|nr:hypothetical protein [Candidatus Acidoferrales bacterium]